jgi:replicative DNA helicase
MVAAETWDAARTPWLVRDRISAAAAEAGTVPDLRPHRQLLEETWNSLSGPNPALPTGFAELDDMIGGIMPGEMIVLGGRPGSSKTTTALCIADYLATELERTVLYHSLEMSARRLTLMRMSRVAEVPLRRLARYEATDLDDRRIADVWPALESTRLLIDDTRHLPLSAMRARLAALKADGDPAALLVVDHVGLVQVPSGMPRNLAVSAVVKGLRDTAEEFGCGVLVVAQLNRGPETRKPPEPLLGDLKDTGELEETADVVLLLAPDGSELKVLIPKNRNGDTGRITLERSGQFARITDQPWSPHGNHVP